MITDLKALGENLTEISGEISVSMPVHSSCYQAGLVEFRPSPERNRVTHAGEEVLVYVVQGGGRLRCGEETFPLKPGVFCRIEANVPHDFQAEGTVPLWMVYVKIRVSEAGEE